MQKDLTYSFPKQYLKAGSVLNQDLPDDSQPNCDPKVS